MERASGKRSSGLRERPFITSASSTGSRSGSVADGGSIGSPSTASAVASAVSRVKSLRPVSSSWSTTEEEKTSARRSTGLPRRCSGAMYEGLPLSTPTAVSGASRSLVMAIPKSRIFTRPSKVRIRFWGLTSRCTTPSG